MTFLAPLGLSRSVLSLLGFLRTSFLWSLMWLDVSSSAHCSLCTSLLPKHTLSLCIAQTHTFSFHLLPDSGPLSALSKQSLPSTPQVILHRTRFLGPDSRAVRLLPLLKRTVVLCVPLRSAFCAGYSLTAPCPSMSRCLHIFCFSNAFTHLLLIIRIRFIVQISYHLI